MLYSDEIGEFVTEACNTRPQLVDKTLGDIISSIAAECDLPYTEGESLDSYLSRLKSAMLNLPTLVHSELPEQ